MIRYVPKVCFTIWSCALDALENDIDGACEIINSHGLRDAKSKVMRIKDLLYYVLYGVKGSEFIMSIAYHIAISRSLMRAAIRDAKIIEKDCKGIVVYAGGDDLLAIVPVSKELDAIY
ncbi:MAG: hypothetical protein QXK35_04245 [Nitrososphaerales archaeon]